MTELPQQRRIDAWALAAAVTGLLLLVAVPIPGPGEDRVWIGTALRCGAFWVALLEYRRFSTSGAEDLRFVAGLALGARLRARRLGAPRALGVSPSPSLFFGLAHRLCERLRRARADRDGAARSSRSGSGGAISPQPSFRCPSRSPPRGSAASSTAAARARSFPPHSLRSRTSAFCSALRAVALRRRGSLAPMRLAAALVAANLLHHALRLPASGAALSLFAAAVAVGGAALGCARFEVPRLRRRIDVEVVP